MLSREGRQYMEIAPRLALWPGLCLTVTVYALNLFGDALRDLLDPRLRGSGGSAVRLGWRHGWIPYPHTVRIARARADRLSAYRTATGPAVRRVNVNAWSRERRRRAQIEPHSRGTVERKTSGVMTDNPFAG